MNIQRSKNRMRAIGIAFTILIAVSVGAIVFAALTDRPVAVSYSVTLFIASVVSTFVCRSNYNTLKHHEKMMKLTSKESTDKL